MTSTDRHLHTVPTPPDPAGSTGSIRIVTQGPAAGRAAGPHAVIGAVVSIGAVPTMVFAGFLTVAASAMGRTRFLPMVWLAALVGWLIRWTHHRLTTTRAGSSRRLLDLLALAFAAAFIAACVAGIVLTLIRNPLVDGAWAPAWVRGDR